jgi:hypothetical protein
LSVLLHPQSLAAKKRGNHKTGANDKKGAKVNDPRPGRWRRPVAPGR